MNQPSRFRRWMPVILWMSLIHYLSSDSFSGTNSLGWLTFWAQYFHLSVSPELMDILNLTLRKTAHFVEFFVLGFLLSRAFVAEPRVRRKALFWTLVIGLTYGLLDEARQVLTASRGPSLRDAGLDFAGTLSSQIFLLLAQRMGSRSKS